MARKPDKLSLKKQSFFKILLGDFSQRLRIPPKFIQNFNGRSLRRCALRGPGGKWWNVELEKRKDGLFLQEGWQHFVNEHQLEDGDFLVFRFDGESKFKVSIYDRTACEKDVEVAEIWSGSPVSLASAGQARVKDESVDCETESYNEKYKMKASNSSRRGIRVTSGKRPKGDHADAISNGSILFKSKNLCFTVNFKKYHLCRMYIPKKLAVAEGLMSKDCIMIQDPTGRSWLVKLGFRQNKSWDCVEMKTGLAECYRANKIVPGDTLIFEFVKESVAKIHIFRKGCKVVLDVPEDAELAETRSGSPISLANEGQARVKEETVDLETKEYNEYFDKEVTVSGKTDNYVSCGKRPAADDDLEAPSVNGPLLFKSKNLCFTVAFTKHHRTRIDIPKKLAIAQGLMSKNYITIQDPTGRSWLVELMFRPNGYSQRVEMRTGLVNFFRANQIVPGDTLIFEFVKDNIAKVHILRKGNHVVLDVPDVGN